MKSFHVKWNVTKFCCWVRLENDFQGCINASSTGFPWPVLLLCQIQTWFNKQQLKKNHLWNIFARLRDMFNLKASRRLYWAGRTIYPTPFLFCLTFLFCKAWPISLNLLSYRNNLCYSTFSSPTLNAWKAQLPSSMAFASPATPLFITRIFIFQMLDF